MEQQQFKVSFSVGTKLLFSVAALLFLAIVFLSTSAVLILTEDKQAYTFESKSTEAMLAGREFSNTVSHVSDTLRLGLASIDPSKPISLQNSDTFKSAIQNQSEIVFANLAFLQPETGGLKPLIGAGNPGLLTLNDLGADVAFLPELTEDWMKTALPDIQKTGIGFVNLSKLGRVPLLAVILADRSVQNLTDGLPVAIGVISLKKLSSELAGLNLTIASRAGWILFDSDPSTLFARKNISRNPLFVSSIGNSVRTGTSEYEAEDGTFLGAYSKPGFDTIVLTQTPWLKAMKATFAVTEKFILLGCMAIGLGIIFAILFSKTLTAPINRLYRATQDVAQGNFDLSIDVGDRDEIGALTDSFNVMSLKIRDLLKESVEKAILEKEIDIASTVQKTLLPGNAFDHPAIKIRGHYQAASSCGGDWWGHFMVGNKLVFGVADATGHGLSSALITATARSCFSVIQRLAEEDQNFNYSPGWMLQQANRAIYDAAQGNIMMTFFMAVLDFDKWTLTYANAAHNPPWLFKKDGDRYKLNSMTPSGNRLGEGPNLAAIDEKTLPISPHDIAFFYTDGLTEGKGLDGEMFGKKRVRNLVESHLTAGPEQIVGTLMKDFLKFNDGKPLDDDVTVAAMLFS